MRRWLAVMVMVGCAKDGMEPVEWGEEAGSELGWVEVGEVTLSTSLGWRALDSAGEPVLLGATDDEPCQLRSLMAGDLLYEGPQVIDSTWDTASGRGEDPVVGGSDGSYWQLQADGAQALPSLSGSFPRDAAVVDGQLLRIHGDELMATDLASGAPRWLPYGDEYLSSIGGGFGRVATRGADLLQVIDLTTGERWSMEPDGSEVSIAFMTPDILVLELFYHQERPVRQQLRVLQLADDGFIDIRVDEPWPLGMRVDLVGSSEGLLAVDFEPRTGETLTATVLRAELR